MRKWAIIRCLAVVLFIALFPSHPATAKPAGRISPSSPLSLPVGHLSVGQQPVPPIGQPDALLTTLVHRADLVVRGRVLAVQSQWQADQRLIESVVTVRVAYALLGKADTVVTVRTPGGYLADEGIGMVSMHAATFAPGEDLLLFLQERGKHLEMVDGAGGKLLVQGEQLISGDWALALPADALLNKVMGLAVTKATGVGVAGVGVAGMGEATKDNVSPFATLWMQDTALLGLPLHNVQAQTDTHKWPTPHATATYYVNTASVQTANGGPSSAALRNAILAAANGWSGVSSADFRLRYGGPAAATATGYNGRNEILFMAKGRNARAAAAEVWYRADGTIVEADIWINDDYRWNTSGTPAANELDLQSALQHEFGHWLILGHFPDSASVMYPKLAPGTVKRVLQAEDMAGISAIYPR